MQNNAQRNKRIVKNTLFLYLRMLLILLVTFYTTRVVLHNLGQDDFGLYNVVSGFVMMLGFLSSALANGTERFINYELGRNNFDSIKDCFNASYIAQLVFSFFSIVVFETVGLWFLNHEMNIPPDRVVAANWIYQFAIISMALGIMKSPFNAIIIAKEKMDFYAIVSIVEATLKLLVAFAISQSTYDKLIVYGFLLLVISLVTYLVTRGYSLKLMPFIKISFHVPKKVFSEVLSFSGWNLLGSVSGVIRSQGINVIMNIFFGVTINAARAVAYQVLGGVQQFTSNFQLAINPQIVQTYASGERSRYLRLTYTSAKISLYLMWLITLPLLFCVEPVLSIWLGSDVPEFTALFIKLILITGLLDALGSSISVPLYATGNIKNYQIIVSAIKVLVLPIAYVLYKIGFPPETAMYVSIILSLAAQIARVLIWANLVGESPLVYFRAIVIRGLIIIIVSLFFLYFLHNYLVGNINSSILIILCDVLFSLMVNIPFIFFVALTKEERRSLSSLLLSKLRR